MMATSSTSKNANSVLCWPKIELNGCNDGYVIGWKEDDEQHTMIAAGVIPSVACKSSEEKYTLNQVQSALQTYKQKLYPCVEKKCQASGFIVQQLEIIAIWKGRSIHTSEQDSAFPVIHQSKSGQKISSIETQLIQFNPCLNDWSYYRHYLDPSYNSIKSQSENEAFYYGPFKRMLMMISETENIISDLNSILRGRSKKSSTEVQKTKNLNDGTEIKFMLLKFPLLAIVYHLFLERDTTNQLVTDRYMTRETKTKNHLQRIERIASSSINAFLGIAFGMFLRIHGSAVTQSISSIWSTIHLQVLGDNILWLESFPVGFKLNVPLTKVMGRAILWFTGTYSYILKGIFSSLDLHAYIHGVAILSILFGFRIITYLSYNVVKISTWHIRATEWIFQKIFFGQLSLFSSLWHLFRGKKKNVLRLRSDTLEYDFMQLFLGMILFAICLFLFTTVLVYYTFFTLISLSFKSCTGLIWVAYIMLKQFPFGEVLMGFVFPPCVACNYSMVENDVNSLVLERSTMSPFHILLGATKQELSRI